MVIDYIDGHRDRVVEGKRLGVEPICAVLNQAGVHIAPRTYYASKKRAPSARRIRDKKLKEQITRVFDENYGAYGARKIHARLNREGTRVARCTVERLMRAMGLKGLQHGRRPRTTPADGPTSGVHDLVERSFTAHAPNRLWVADITYVRTRRPDITAPVFVAERGRPGRATPEDADSPTSCPWLWIRCVHPRPPCSRSWRWPTTPRPRRRSPASRRSAACLPAPRSASAAASPP
ncbi:IS3 family transposase [Streptomonospora alba]|uniref:IS3 family transposase n=1 Tax=Streptomonospora alba TaxID=183763 RepID=UPI00146FCD10